MFNSDQIIKRPSKMSKIIATWIYHIFDVAGFTAVIIAFIQLDVFERIILFLGSTAFLGYRLYHMHLDAQRKRNDLEEQRMDLEEQRYDLNKKKSRKIEDKNQ